MSPSSLPDPGQSLPRRGVYTGDALLFTASQLFGDSSRQSGSKTKKLEMVPRSSRPKAHEARDSKCHLLHSIPIEVRKMIWAQLLVNEVLADPKCITQSGSTYGLSPSVLRCCWQMYNETSEVLYQKNTFLAVLQYHDDIHSSLYRRSVLSSAFANHDKYKFSAKSETVKSNPLLGKIRRWILIPNMQSKSRYEIANNIQSLFDFCKMLRTANLLSLTVIVQPRIRYYRGFRNGNWGADWPLPLINSLYPLKMLSRVPKFELIQQEAGTHPFDELFQDFEKVKLDLHTSLMQGSVTSVLFGMFENLLHYAQAFERHDKYKLQMEPGYKLIPTHPDTSVVSDINTHTFYLTEVISQLDSKYFESPFMTCRHYHPVECGLILASYAWETSNMVLFKQARAHIVDYLEPQYKRISSASKNYNECVKLEKRHGGFLSPYSGIKYHSGPMTYESMEQHSSSIGELLIDMEIYSKSFVRQVPRETQAYMNSMRRPTFESEYAQLTREKLMKTIIKLFDTRQDCKVLASAIQNITDDMDKQYMQISTARSQLFAYETDDFGVDLDLDSGECDELVNWTAAEPDIGCLLEAEMLELQEQNLHQWGHPWPFKVSDRAAYQKALAADVEKKKKKKVTPK